MIILDFIFLVSVEHEFKDMSEEMEINVYI